MDSRATRRKAVHDPAQEPSGDPPLPNPPSLASTSAGPPEAARGTHADHRTSGQHHQPKRGLTFRVRGVPTDWDVDRLRCFLADQDESAGPDVKSLADEIHGRSRTATVSFQNVPRQLEAGRSWQISPPIASNQSSRSQSLTLDGGFLGITTLYTPPPHDHKVDIIAISGLGGHAFGSFKERGGEHMWLRDALPYHIAGQENLPLARVMVFGYESSLPQSENTQNLEDLASSFHGQLLDLASALRLKPIIFVAHSLEGLIVKQTVISLSKSRNEDDQKLVRAVYGLIFFGVPHHGMDIHSKLLGKDYLSGIKHLVNNFKPRRTLTRSLKPKGALEFHSNPKPPQSYPQFAEIAYNR